MRFENSLLANNAAFAPAIRHRLFALLNLECVSRRDYEEFGDVVERDALLGYLDIIGETDEPTATIWSMMGVAP